MTYNWSSTPPGPYMESLKSEEILSGVRENVSLAPYTTFKIGGKVRYFFVAKTKDDIIEAVRAARKMHTPFFILGGGSNLLVSDKGFRGLVIKIQNTKYKIQNTKLYAEAGVPMTTLVRETTKRGLAGLEWAGGLPGSLGGAVRGNAGAFGGETKDCIAQVECIDEKGRLRKLSKKLCRFSYRSSIFKEKKWIVLSAVLHFTKEDPKILTKTVKFHIQYRKDRHPMEFPNAGSIFKNCDLKKIPPFVQKFAKEAIKTDPFKVVPTAFLIAKAELKGVGHGGAQISEKHPNYIVNKKQARAKDVQFLIKKIKNVIRKRFSVKLEEEIEKL